MIKANGDAPSSPVRNRMCPRRLTVGGAARRGPAPALGTGGWNPRRFLGGLPPAAWRISRLARPIELLHGGEASAGRRSCASGKGPPLSALTTCPCWAAQPGWIAPPPSPLGDFPFASPVGVVHGARRTTGGRGWRQSPCLKGVWCPHLLYTHPDVPITKEQIYEAVWCAPSNHCLHAPWRTPCFRSGGGLPPAGGHDLSAPLPGSSSVQSRLSCLSVHAGTSSGNGKI